MEHLNVPQVLGLMAIMLAAAKLGGALTQAIKQPAVLGELAAGVLLGTSAAGLVDPRQEVIHLLAELGVVILLFEIGLETDLRKLMQVGGTSAVVAIVGVTLPFVLGYGACWLLGQPNLVCVVAGATLTATSVGITARVLRDLNRLQAPESQIIIGAAVIDDVIGLIILAVVTGITQGEDLTPVGICKTVGTAVGFLAGTLVLGGFIVPPLFRLLGARIKLPGSYAMFAIILAFGLAWLAAAAGSALIIGAFAAGLLLRGAPQVHDIEKEITTLGHLFVPLFFVAVGAAVNVAVLNPLDAANWSTLAVGGVLILAAVIGKFAAGYAPFWFKGNKKVIGVGMIPRGEVGLIFAQMGLSTGVFDAGLFSAVTMMVIVTTFMTPPLLTLLFSDPSASRPLSKAGDAEGVEELVTKAI